MNYVSLLVPHLIPALAGTDKVAAGDVGIGRGLWECVLETRKGVSGGKVEWREDHAASKFC